MILVVEHGGPQICQLVLAAKLDLDADRASFSSLLSRPGFELMHSITGNSFSLLGCESTGRKRRTIDQDRKLYDKKTVARSRLTKLLGPDGCNCIINPSGSWYHSFAFETELASLPRRACHSADAPANILPSYHSQARVIFSQIQIEQASPVHNMSQSCHSWRQTCEF